MKRETSAFWRSLVPLSAIHFSCCCHKIENETQLKKAGICCGLRFKRIHAIMQGKRLGQERGGNRSYCIYCLEAESKHEVGLGCRASTPASSNSFSPGKSAAVWNCLNTNTWGYIWHMNHGNLWTCHLEMEKFETWRKWLPWSIWIGDGFLCCGCPRIPLIIKSSYFHSPSHYRT